MLFIIIGHEEIIQVNTCSRLVIALAILILDHHHLVLLLIIELLGLVRNGLLKLCNIVIKAAHLIKLLELMVGTIVNHLLLIPIVFVIFFSVMGVLRSNSVIDLVRLSADGVVGLVIHS